MTLRLVMIDLDQTLLRADKTYDRQRFKDILNQCKEAGILVCIATGNTYHKIEDYFDEESCQDLYFACDNGNYIVKNDETLEIIGIGHDVFLDIAKFVDQFEDYHIAMSVGPHLYFRESSGRIYDHVKQYHDDIKVVESFHDIPNSELVTKIAMYSEVSLDQNKVLTRILNERYHEVAAVTSGGGWVDVYSIHGGKGSAAHYLQGKYDLEARHTMAFGDSLNDQKEGSSGTTQSKKSKQGKQAFGGNRRLGQGGYLLYPSSTSRHVSSPAHGGQGRAASPIGRAF